MPGLASKITKDFKSKKKEDLVKEVMYSSFESTWFKVEDTETDMPWLDKKKVEKLFFVDGSKRHIKKYSEAIYKSLKSIAPISRVVNNDNLKEISRSYREKIKKESKLKWPKLNFAHSYYEGLEILTLTIGLVVHSSVDDPETIVKERCIKIGEFGPLQLVLVVDQDGALKETIIDFIHAINKAKGIHVPPHHLLTVEEFCNWKSER